MVFTYSSSGLLLGIDRGKVQFTGRLQALFGWNRISSHGRNYHERQEEAEAKDGLLFHDGIL